MKLEVQIVISSEIYNSLPSGYQSIEQLNEAVFKTIAEAWVGFKVSPEPLVYRREYDPSIYSHHATFKNQVPIILFIDPEQEIIVDTVYGNRINVSTLRSVLKFWVNTTFDGTTGEYLTPTGPISTQGAPYTGNILRSLPNIFKNENGFGVVPGPGYGVDLPGWVWLLLGAAVLRAATKKR